jgi:hypothetical protein
MIPDTFDALCSSPIHAEPTGFAVCLILLKYVQNKFYLVWDEWKKFKTQYSLIVILSRAGRPAS